MTAKKSRQGNFIKELSAKKPAPVSKVPAKKSVGTWRTPIASPLRPVIGRAPAFNNMRSRPAPTPLSDVPIADSGRIDVAAVKKIVQTLNKKFHKKPTE